MNNEQERPFPDDRESQDPGAPTAPTGPMPRVRLPGYDEPAPSHGPARDWQGQDLQDQDWQGYDQPRHYPGYPRDHGIRRSRRASTWTAAALIAGVAATTGYLAHSIPASGSGSGTSGGTVKPTPAPTTVTPSTPAVKPPVVTSGGSGAAGGGDN